MSVEIGVYVPQVGLRWDELRAKVQACDALGIHSVWFMDHLYPPMLPQVPAFEAWTTAAALAPATERVRFGHLVLCNGFRHPALLAKMAITLDHASGGRLALGIGSGSYAPEFAEFGIPFPPGRERAARLAEALEVIRRLFGEATASFEGEYYRLCGVPCRWWRATPTSGTAQPTRSPSCRTSSRSCAPNASASGAIRRRWV